MGRLISFSFVFNPSFATVTLLQVLSPSSLHTSIDWEMGYEEHLTEEEIEPFKKEAMEYLVVFGP